MNISKVDYMTFAEVADATAVMPIQPQPSHTLSDLLKMSPFKGKSVTSVKGYSKEELHLLFTVASEMRLGVEREGCLDILKGRVLCLMFFEPFDPDIVFVRRCDEAPRWRDCHDQRIALQHKKG